MLKGWLVNYGKEKESDQTELESITGKLVTEFLCEKINAWMLAYMVTIFFIKFHEF